ncbi:MAG: HD domain-containing protein [Deferribacteraceae bacterium]|nr:HD domain-containing protein [Deferribacteraceae bacterium]
MFALLLDNLRKLNNVMRWSNEFLHRRASVAEHSFCVAQIAQMLGFIEESLGRTVDWKLLYRKALNHDVPEAVVGDVISTTKNVNQDIHDTIKKVEVLLVENMIAELSEPFRSEYRTLFFDGKDESTEGKILTAADNIDALIECLQEIKLSNTVPFAEKYGIIKAKIEKIPLASAQYFIKEILPSLAGGVGENL